MLVRELMTGPVKSTSPPTTLAEAARRMRDGKIGCLPVGSYDEYIGILTEQDLTFRATAEGLNPLTTTVCEVMSSGVIYCQEDDSAEDALAIMREKHIRHLPVRNRSNKVVGIVSLSDLALRGPEDLYLDVSRLAFRQATRTGSALPVL